MENGIFSRIKNQVIVTNKFGKAEIMSRQVKISERDSLRCFKGNILSIRFSEPGFDSYRLVLRTRASCCYYIDSRCFLLSFCSALLFVVVVVVGEP